jgi:L-lactate utilization protein LutC
MAAAVSVGMRLAILPGGRLAASPYGVFLAGPSATGDIEGVIIHGAQGARSLTVLLLAPAEA